MRECFVQCSNFDNFMVWSKSIDLHWVEEIPLNFPLPHANLCHYSHCSIERFMRCREEGGKHRGKVEIEARTESMDGREGWRHLSYFTLSNIP